MLEIIGLISIGFIVILTISVINLNNQFKSFSNNLKSFRLDLEKLYNSNQIINSNVQSLVQNKAESENAF